MNSRVTTINEPINVWVFFSDNNDKSSIEPYVIFWRNRRIKIDTINLSFTSKDGDRLFYHFSTSSGGNYYLLKFEPENMRWFLEEVEQ